MREPHPTRVLIVGGGASGVLTAARIMDTTAARPAHVTVVEPGARLAAGVAYSTEDPEHLLNVRASMMSADPSDPDDLVRWISQRGTPDREAFVPRRDYRDYLVDHLDRAVERAAAGSVEVLRDRVLGLSPAPEGSCGVHLESGRIEPADHVVLAIGNPPPAIPAPLDELDGHHAWVPDPWAPGALAAHDGAARVLLVGTGLTMVDVAFTLGRECPDAELIGLSRHGLLPIHVVELDRDGEDMAALVERVRARAEDGVGTEYPDEDWREVIDAIRPYANALWRRWDPEQRGRFLQQVLRHWDVHRHRMSPPTAARLADLLDRDRLRLRTGEVCSVAPLDDRRVQVELATPQRGETLTVDAVINCTGPGRPWATPANPVVADLFARGLARPDPLGLGLDTTPEGFLVGVSGEVTPQVTVIGPPRRGTLFETTAVPELRSQALHIADHIAAAGPAPRS